MYLTPTLLWLVLSAMFVCSVLPVPYRHSSTLADFCALKIKKRVTKGIKVIVNYILLILKSILHDLIS